jgi:hypothetical protein
MSSVTVQATINDQTTGFNKSASLAFTTTGNDIDFRRVSIGTSEVEHTIIAGIGDAGYCWIRNADATNYVEVGFSTTVYSMKLLAGQVALFPLAPAQASIFLKANTAACDCEVYVHEA